MICQKNLVHLYTQSVYGKFADFMYLLSLKDF